MTCVVVMDADGVCREHHAPDPLPSLASHTSAGGVELRLHARPVASEAQLDDRLLQVALPLPFGRALVAAPVYWSAARQGRARDLDVPQLNDMLQACIRHRETSVASGAVLLTTDHQLPSDESQSEDETDEDEGDEEEEEVDADDSEDEEGDDDE